MSDIQNPLRLRKKHGSGIRTEETPDDGRRIVDAQSIRNAIVTGFIVIIIFSIFWVALTELSNRVFPWFTVLLGVSLGYSIRLTGRGTNWHFPLTAGVLTLIGALFSNIVVAASVTAEGFDTGTLDILQAVTGMTWPVFFDEVLTVADFFYAVVGAGLAGFLANRRLTRSEYRALRLWQEDAQID
jgi:hypothetical protein